MDDIQLLETIEKYLSGEMSPAEASQFESLRKTNPEIDQMVVEHDMLLHEMDNYANRKNFSKLSEITFNTLFDAGTWTPVNEQSTTYKIIQLWHSHAHNQQIKVLGKVFCYQKNPIGDECNNYTQFAKTQTHCRFYHKKGKLYLLRPCISAANYNRVQYFAFDFANL